MNRLIHARLLLAVVIALTIGTVEVGNLVSSKPADRAPGAHVIESGFIPMLATIRVQAPDEIPTLPLVLVRPTPAQLTDAESTVAVASIAPSAHSSSVSTNLPHVRLDMPYYSFGKMLPNVIKD